MALSQIGSRDSDGHHTDDRRTVAHGGRRIHNSAYYERIGLIQSPARIGGQRRYHHSILARLDVIRLCKAAGFSLDEIQLLFADNASGRPASRALAETQLAQIDARITELIRAREIIEWGMRCACPSIDDCTCGIHTDKPFSADTFAISNRRGDEQAP